MAHIGVKNRTQDKQVLVHDGRSVAFDPGQIRLVEGISSDFVESRLILSHQTKKNAAGEDVQLPALKGLRIFEVLTIDEALKAGARPDEDPRVLIARAELEAKRKERQALLADLKASLVEEGWAPPKSAKAAKQEVV